MSNPTTTHPRPGVVTRRQALAGIALVFAGVATGSKAIGDAPGNMKEAPALPENLKRTSIHQEVDFKTGPRGIYEALLDSKQFASFTGLPAEIDPREGGAFSLFGGLILGRNIELVPGLRVVQAWRAANWEAGKYSVARFELKAQGTGSTLVFDHTAFPEGDYDSLLGGWQGHYWGPLAKYLALGGS